MAKQAPARNDEYLAYVKNKMPKSNLWMDLLKAFAVGGSICCIGQLISYFGETVLLLPEKELAAYNAIVLVFIGAFLTGIGVYDKIGGFAGAGSVVPITGFANSIVAPAMEFKREGYVMGVGAKLFSIAGPVLVYGISSSIVAGIITWLVG